MNKDVFEKLPVPKAVATLATPTVLSMLVTVFYNMADTFFVGQTGDSNQVAAVSLATPVFLLFMACGNMFGIGGSSYISRSLGEGKKERVHNISSFCFYGCIITGLILMAIMLLNLSHILRLIGADQDTEKFAGSYLKYIATGGIFIVISNAFGNIVRGEGAAKAAMTGMMIGTVVNIILDPIMILVLNMGVAGAAIATIIGNIAAVIFYLLYMMRKDTLLSFRLKDFRYKDKILMNVLSIGLPASINNVLMSVANIILNKFLVSYGNAPVAAMGVAMKANMLVIFLQMGIAMGVQPLVGYNYGAKNYERMRSCMKFAMGCTMMIGTVMTGIYLIASKFIIHIFIDDIDVINYGIIMLRALMISGPFIGVMFTFNFSFQAMNKAIQSLLLSLSRQGLVFLPILVIGNELIGLNGIIYAQPIADVASLCMAAAMFFKINKKFKREEEAVSSM